MKNLLLVFIFVCLSALGYSQPKFEFQFGEEVSFDNLISGSNPKAKTLKWFNVNTNKDTWSVRGDSLVATGHPLGVVRSEKQYENFILHVEWKHMEPGGNSGVFVWSSGALVKEGNPYPNGVEVQMLDPEWVNLNRTSDGQPQTKAYISGEMWGVNGVVTVPDNPRGERSRGLEYRVNGNGKWNTYQVVCTDGNIKLAINGKFVNGISKSTQKKGYICIESEGAEIRFRNFKIIELPPGITSPEQAAAVL